MLAHNLLRGNGRWITQAFDLNDTWILSYCFWLELIRSACQLQQLFIWYFPGEADHRFRDVCLKTSGAQHQCSASTDVQWAYGQTDTATRLCYFWPRAPRTVQSWLSLPPPHFHTVRKGQCASHSIELHGKIYCSRTCNNTRECLTLVEALSRRQRRLTLEFRRNNSMVILLACPWADRIFC